MDRSPELLGDAVHQVVRRIDPSIAHASVAAPRFAFVLVGLFAALAILLAAIGTYGVIAYSVSQRTPEFGLRMALGAQRTDVLRLVLKEATKLVLTGTTIGVILALIMARVLTSLIITSVRLIRLRLLWLDSG